MRRGRALCRPGLLGWDPCTNPASGSPPEAGTSSHLQPPAQNQGSARLVRSPVLAAGPTFPEELHWTVGQPCSPRCCSLGQQLGLPPLPPSGFNSQQRVNPTPMFHSRGAPRPSASCCPLRQTQTHVHRDLLGTWACGNRAQQ